MLQNDWSLSHLSRQACMPELSVWVRLQTRMQDSNWLRQVGLASPPLNPVYR